MNGNDKYTSVKEKVEGFSDKLEKYMVQQGVPIAEARHIDHYINMPRSELSALTPQELEEIAFEISAFAYHLQCVINIQQAKADNCKAQIEKLIGPVLGQYKDIYGKEEKWLAAISDNDEAQEFRKYEVNSRLAVTRMAYLTLRLENISKCISELREIKRRYHG